MRTKRLTTTEVRNKMIDKLDSSCITKPSDIKALGYKPMVGSKVKTLGNNFEERGGIYIPYYTLDGKVDKEMFRIRYVEKGVKVRTRDKVVKYMQPSGVPPKLYLPPIHDWEAIASNPETPILITEGEFKASCACLHDFPTIGIGGVYGWKSSKRLLPMIPDFKRFVWKARFERDGQMGEFGRQVILVFDADLKTNPLVQQALKELCDELMGLGAEPRVAFVEEIPEAPKTGLDDFIYHRGDVQFESTIKKAQMYSLAGNLVALNSEVVYVQKIGAVVNLNNGELMRPADFTGHHFSNRHYYEEMFNKDGGTRIVKKQAAKAWVNWEHRNELHNLVCRPSEPKFTHDDCYNLWDGWGCEPIKGDIKPWHDLMGYVFGKDKKARLWFERWCAIQFQQPGVKLFSAVMMWSTFQGTGKTFIGEIVGSIFGDRNYAIAKQENIRSTYNQWRVTKQFVLGDEITGTDRRKDGDFLKALITNVKTQVEEKFKPTYEIYDMTNYYFTSNHADALFLENSDRRFFIWNILGKPKPKEFYEKIKSWIDDGGKEALFHHFLTLDLGGFKATDDAYMTVAKEQMIYTSKSEVDAWVDLLKRHPETVLRTETGMEITGDLFTSKRLTDLYHHQTGDGSVKSQGMSKKLKQADFTWAHEGGEVRVGNEGAKRLIIVRNVNKWVDATPKQLAQHFGINDSKFKKID